MIGSITDQVAEQQLLFRNVFERLHLAVSQIIQLYGRRKDELCTDRNRPSFRMDNIWEANNSSSVMDNSG